jgi:hypothetical protein
VANARIEEQLAGARVVDHLMDVDGDAPIRSSVNPSGSTLLEIAANCLFQ